MRYAIAAKSRGDAVAHVKWVMKNHDINRQLDIILLGVNTRHDIEKIRGFSRGGLTVYMCTAIPFEDGEFADDMLSMFLNREAVMMQFPADECQPWVLRDD